jgi:hypothetical protein
MRFEQGLIVRLHNTPTNIGANQIQIDTISMLLKCYAGSLSTQCLQV